MNCACHRARCGRPLATAACASPAAARSSQLHSRPFCSGQRCVCGTLAQRRCRRHLIYIFINCFLLLCLCEVIALQTY